jgi:hypothetical protein
MIYGFSETRIDPRQSRNWSVPYEFNHFDQVNKENVEYVGEVQTETKETLITRLFKAKVLGWEPGVEQQYLDWAPERDMSGRDLQHVHKLAIMTALLNDHR